MKFLHIGVPMFDLDLHEETLAAENHLAHHILGYKKLTLSDIFSTDDQAMLLQTSRRSKRAHLNISTQCQLTWFPHLNHSYQGTFEITFSPTSKSNMIVITMIDQSNWAKQNHRTNRFAHFLRNLLDLTNTLFFVLDRSYRVVFANKAFDQHVGIQASTQASHSLKASHYTLSLQNSMGLEEQFFELVHECINHKVARATQIHWSSYTGESKTFQIMTYSLKDQEKNTEQILILGSDITALVRAHEEQKQLQTALNESKRLDMIGQMAGTIAHDFNGFLTVISSSISLLELEVTDTDQQDLLTGVTEVCHQAKQLTQDLLAYSRSQVSRLQYSSIDKLSSHLAFALPRLSNEHVKVTWTSEIQTRKKISLSEAQCSQIIMNLVNNAIEAIASDTRGEVMVHCYDDQDHTKDQNKVILTVSDNGQGIASELLQDIFEPFFTTKKISGGTGLGLASAHALVKKSGGSLSVQSTLGEGTVFKVCLPLIEID